MMTVDREILTALREAPFDPQFWASALSATARACGAASAQLLTFGPARFTPIVAPGFSSDDIGDFVALDGTDPALNLGLKAVQGSRLHDVIADVEYLSESQRSRDRLYSDFFRRFDGDFVASGTVASNDEATCNINLFFPERTGGLDSEGRRRLKRVLPHFTAAVLLTTRLKKAALALAAGAWDVLGEAGVICSADGGILHANQEAEYLLESGDPVGMRQGKIFGRTTGLADPLLQAIGIAADPLAPRPHSLFARCEGGIPFALDIVPLPMSSAFLPAALLLIRRLVRSIHLDGDLLKAAHGFTPAECAVADGIIRRLSSAEIAKERGVSTETINTQVKSLLAKTECANRAQLTRALEGFARNQRRAFN